VHQPSDSLRSGRARVSSCPVGTRWLKQKNKNQARKTSIGPRARHQAVSKVHRPPGPHGAVRA